MRGVACKGGSASSGQPTLCGIEVGQGVDGSNQDLGAAGAQNQLSTLGYCIASLHNARRWSGDIDMIDGDSLIA